MKIPCYDQVLYLERPLLQQVWDNKGNVSAWSEPAFWQMGFLNVADWKAQWIKAGYNEDTLLRPSPLFRKTFTAASVG